MYGRMAVQVFVNAVVDRLVCGALYNPSLIPIIHELVKGTSYANLSLITLVNLHIYI